MTKENASIRKKTKFRDEGEQKRFAAKLLFQYRVGSRKQAGRRRICEERIINFLSKDALSALAFAKNEGLLSQDIYRNSDNKKVYFEFIGVMELLCLEPICRENEVWYDIKVRVDPEKRKQCFIPDEHELNAIRHGE